MTNPQLSIIVPIYNVEQYLTDCLNSIYALHSINYEVILVNDGSPDNSSVIIELFNKKHPDKTVVVNRENGGLSAARNSGIDVAKGQYIALIDSDDYIHSDVLLELYQNAIAEDLDIAIGQSVTFWEDTQSPVKTLSIPDNIIQLGATTGLDFFEKSFLSKYKRINCWNKIYKQEFIKKHNLSFIEKLLFEDVPFTFEAFFAATRVRAFPLDYYYYRQRPGSIMTSSNQKSDPSRLVIINRLLDLINDEKYLGNAFDDYLIYQLWENACGTNQRHLKFCKIFLCRRKMSLRGLARILSIIAGFPNSMPE
jgi:glycosyltransferase involved in cell wall biosynthesis